MFVVFINQVYLFIITWNISAVFKYFWLGH